MAVEMIDSIRSAEANAAEIRKNAVAKAKETVAAADEKAKNIAMETEKKAYDESSRILAEADRNIAALTEEQNKAFAVHSSEIRKNAEVKVDMAADFILKELLEI